MCFYESSTFPMQFFSHQFDVSLFVFILDPMVLRGPYKVPGMEPRLAIRKIITLPAVLSL